MFKLLFILLILGQVDLYAQEKSEKDNKGDNWEKTQIHVIGEKRDTIHRIPGSATVIGKKDLEENRPMDTMEALRRVPGANIRYQDPAGMTMNLGFRGVSNELSRKVLILEDGLPVSLNPYGEPEMYYSPSIERMQRIEVVKGSGSILYGPSTIGGVVNFVTRNPTIKPAFYTTTIGGEHGYFSTVTGYGGTFGNTGMDISYVRKQGNGFRDSNGFRMNEINFKTITQLNEKHSFSTKFGYHEQQASVTYLGLTTGMFNGYPTKRTFYDPTEAKKRNPLTELGDYKKSATQNPAEQDKRIIERWSASVGHEWNLTDNFKLVSKIYAYGTKRDWTRQEYTRNTKIGEAPPTSAMILYDSEIFTDRPGDSVWMRNTNAHRNRDYFVSGVESRLQGDFQTGSIKHEVDLGIKHEYNRANARLLTGADTQDYNVNLDISQKQQLVSSPYSLSNSGALRDDERREAKALAVWFQDRIKLTDRFAIIPGVRYESIRQSRDTYRSRAFDELTYNYSGNTSYQIDTQGKSRTHVVLPGFGTTFQILDNFVWFAGAHRGFAPPRYESAVSTSGSDLNLKSEMSWNYETGIRGDLTNYLYTQLVGYYLDFQEQIINSSAAGGNLGSRPINAGKTTHKGAEFTLSLDFGTLLNQKYSLTLDTTYSNNNARSNQYTYNSKSLLDGKLDPALQKDTNGKFLPYTSRETGTVGLGLSFKSGFYGRVDYQHFSKQYHDLQNTKTVYWHDEIAKDANLKSVLSYLDIKSDADGTNGVIPAYGILNASLGYKSPDKSWSLFINGKNLQDKKYISTRLPEGIQPGPTRQVNVGMTIQL